MCTYTYTHTYEVVNPLAKLYDAHVQQRLYICKLYVCVRLCMCMCVCVCVYTHTYIHTHTAYNVEARQHVE